MALLRMVRCFRLLRGVDAEYSEPIPDYLRIGEKHPIVLKLQQRLMDLGFMDNDEPTDYYGEVTQSAVKIYQRQNKSAQDGIIGPDNFWSDSFPDAKALRSPEGWMRVPILPVSRAVCMSLAIWPTAR